MTKVPQAMLLASIVAFGTTANHHAFAQNAPQGPHPRLWLDAATQQALARQASSAESPVKRAQTRCHAASVSPAEYATGGWQGFEFVLTLSACLASYEATQNGDDLATAIKYFRVLLDDYQNVGDGLGGDGVVTHDTGYAMRTFAPYSALAYDWLHDAPGVTEELRAHARARFDAWSTYYAQQGYLRDLAGANYQAGYAFAATLIAIAEAGEAGAAGDLHWANVRDQIWKKTLVPAMSAGGVLEGGDWPEGWQYGSLSVLEHALGARALQGCGLALPEAEAWASALPLRFAHGLTPGARQAFVGGDSDSTTAYRTPDNGALLAAILGPGNAEAKALARQLNGALQLENENALFDALAAATTGDAAALPDTAPKSYLARGTSNLYVRSDWTPSASFGVFQCSRHLVDDHQFPNAGNWVLSRGADDLVVDPSPYGTLSTLTGNAPAVDSSTLPSGYSPSQGFWGKSTGLRWARQSGSGVAAARCDYADQFGRDDATSDVTAAQRDFVLFPTPHGSAVVLLDRVQTGGADHALHLRVRSPASLALSGDEADATLGGSSLAIHKVWASSGTPNVRVMPKASECPSSDHACDVSKLDAGSEYRIDVSGPSAGAIHVVSAQPAADSTPASSTLLSGAGYRGVAVEQDGQKLIVVASDNVAAPAAGSLIYRAPASASLHVVLDAPGSTNGSSDVKAAAMGGDCELTITPHVGAGDGIPSSPLIVRVGADCSVSDDGTEPSMPPALPPGSGGAPGGGGTVGSSLMPTLGGATASGGTGSSGELPLQPAPSDAGCALARMRSGPRQRRVLWLSAFAGLGVAHRRRRRGPRARKVSKRSSS